MRLLELQKSPLLRLNQVGSPLVPCLNVELIRQKKLDGIK